MSFSGYRCRVAWYLVGRGPQVVDDLRFWEGSGPCVTGKRLDSCGPAQIEQDVQMIYGKDGVGVGSVSDGTNHGAEFGVSIWEGVLR